MKNFALRFIPLCSLMVFASVSLNSCNNNDEDPNKFYVKVGAKDGAMGIKWLPEIKEAFEEKYKDYTDPAYPNKKGVVVKGIASNSFGGSTLLKTKNLNCDCYFTEDVRYLEFIANDLLLDITDVITEPNKFDSIDETTGKNKTILSKMHSGMPEFLNIGTKENPKYYALPYVDSFQGFIFDYELFDREGYFLKSDGKTFGAKSTDDDLFIGRDGIKGTYDDGLPASYTQFDNLCSYIESNGIQAKKAVGYPNQNARSYCDWALRNVWTTYDGYDNCVLNFNLDGTLSKEYIHNGTADINITSSNGYEMFKTEGKYQAMHFGRDFLRSHVNTNLCGNQECEVKLIETIHNTQPPENRVAMIIDGAWFEIECKEWIDIDDPEKGKLGRNFAFMPIPVEDSVYEKEKASNTPRKQALYCGNQMFVIPSKSTKYPELTKDFLRFTHTDWALSNYSKNISMARSFKYELTDEDKEKSSFYTKYLIKYCNASDIIYPYSQSQGFSDNAEIFNAGIFPFKTSDSQQFMFDYFIATDPNRTAEEHFNKSCATYKSDWIGKESNIGGY